MTNQFHPWAQEEDDLLRHCYRKMTREQLLAILPGRSRIAIKDRLTKLSLTTPKEPDWTPADLEYLRQTFDKEPLAIVANHLSRTETAVKVKAKRLGLRHRQRRELTANQIGDLLHVDLHKVKSWIRRRWLAARLAPTAEKRIHLVAPEDLVEFLRARPKQWDARRCPNLHVRLGLTQKRGEAALGDRPAWLKDKLAWDIRKGRRGRRWTLEEDYQLARLIKRQLSYPEIAKLLGRPAHAIAHRVHRLGSRIWELGKQQGA